MKTTRIVCLLLVLLSTVTIIHAAGTPAGTAITNYAIGDYKDVNLNPMPRITSNTVTTLVSQIAGVDVNPSAAANNLSANGLVVYPIRVTNTGNGTDNLSLAVVTGGAETGTYSIELFQDANNNGLIDVSETTISETGNLTADQYVNLLVRVTDTSGATDGDIVVVTLTATSGFNNTVSDTATLTSTITAATLMISSSSSPAMPIPGEVVTYTVWVQNNGTASAYNVVISVPIPGYTTYITSSMRTGTSSDYNSAAIQTDDAGDDMATFAANTVTAELGTIAGGSGYYVFFQFVVDANVPIGTTLSLPVDATYTNITDVPYPPIYDAGGSGSNIIIDQYFEAALTAAITTAIANPSDKVNASFSAENAGNGPDVIELRYTSSTLTWQFYLDFNGNGIIDPGDVLLTDSDGDGLVDTDLLSSGQMIWVIAQTTIPPGTSDGDVETTSITGISGNDPIPPAASFSFNFTITVTAPNLLATKTVSPTGTQPPGTVLTYRADVVNLGSGAARDLVITDQIPDHTTYIPESLELNGNPKTDLPDADQGTMVGNAAVFTIPSIGPGGSNYVTFQVSID